jgi:hypothetical protein
MNLGRIWRLGRVAQIERIKRLALAGAARL